MQFVSLLFIHNTAHLRLIPVVAKPCKRVCMVGLPKLSEFQNQINDQVNKSNKSKSNKMVR